MTVPLVKLLARRWGEGRLDSTLWWHRAEHSCMKRRLLKLSYGRWIAHDNHASAALLDLAAEIHALVAPNSCPRIAAQTGTCALPDAFTSLARRRDEILTAQARTLVGGWQLIFAIAHTKPSSSRATAVTAT